MIGKDGLTLLGALVLLGLGAVYVWKAPDPAAPPEGETGLEEMQRLRKERTDMFRRQLGLM